MLLLPASGQGSNIYIYFPVFFIPCVCVTQEWDRKAEDARREYEKAMKEYEGGRGESSKR